MGMRKIIRNEELRQELLALHRQRSVEARHRLTQVCRLQASPGIDELYEKLQYLAPILTYTGKVCFLSSQNIKCRLPLFGKLSSSPL